MSTIGDQILDKPLPKIGEKSLFTKELEIALLNSEVDLLVHSLKDLPTTLPDGLAIGAILEREDPRDALVLNTKHKGLTLTTLPEGSVIGTSSLRRIAQLRRNFPKLVVKDIRGNLQTRLKKLNQGLFDGIILAVAGIQRMGWEDRISYILPDTDMLYAVGQGALAVECRVKDCSIFARLNHQETVLRCVAERTLLNTLGGGCSAPVAVTSCLTDDNLQLTGAVWSLDGSCTLQKTITGKISNTNSKDIELDKMYCGFPEIKFDKCDVELAEKIGIDVANDLSEKGALKIIEEAKAANAASIN